VEKDMKTHMKTAADIAADLAGDKHIKDLVEKEVNQSKLVMTISRIRIEKGVSQKELAQKMGCTQSKISKIESGPDERINWGDLVEYLDALGVEMSILLDEPSLPAALRIKQHVLATKHLLDELAEIAKDVDDDNDIVSKIHEFYGEVLFNFLVKYGESVQKLNKGVEISKPSFDLLGFIKPLNSRESENKKMHV